MVMSVCWKERGGLTGVGLTEGMGTSMMEGVMVVVEGMVVLARSLWWRM